MDWLLSWSVWHWLILAFLLLIAEVLIPGVFLLWWGISAIFVAILTALLPISLTTAGIVFAVLASSLCLIWWFFQSKRDRIDDQKTELNQRTHTLLHKQGQVVEILGKNVARAKFGDTTWRVEGENLQPDSTVIVIDVKGITLIVKPISYS